VTLLLASALRADSHAIGRVDAGRLASPDPADWLAHGRTWDEQRHSPLAQIDRENVSGLGLAWSFATGTKRGLEATPIVVDGVLYATSTWSVVYALDAGTGALRWVHDPKVPRAKGRDACCDVVNRGVAVWKGRVYAGTLDGRLIALDAGTGELIWETLTVDPAKPYTITGAPRVVKDKVFIGNGGAEFGVRGYFGAYDTDTGKLLWRFYTVPASREGPHENPALALAAPTWSPDSLWESGLGGTVWDSMAYDPELDLLYVGVGNASVYNREQRSPGGGDNLFLASILAVQPDTGELIWHYQTTPGERWDYTATQHMVLADLAGDDGVRKVLMQAPKNGFFYVLDRATGALVSAENYVDVSWAEGIDPATGRPIERQEADWDHESAIVTPAIYGGHNWHPMSYSPATGLVYIPANHGLYQYVPDPAFRFRPGSGQFNTAESFPSLMAAFEGFESLRLAVCHPTQLVAWDPRGQRARWRVDSAASVPGGVLSTAGGLVFQGDGGGVFRAFDAASGSVLWEERTGVGIMAPPVSYAVDGEQHIAVLAGIGGSQGGHGDVLEVENDGRLLAFKLGGTAAAPPVRERTPPPIEAPELDVSDAEIETGRDLYAEHCMRCHGLGAHASGVYPDLRHARRAVWKRWDDIVLGGARTGGGMASFADVLDAEGSARIRAYVASRARHEPGVLERSAAWAAKRGCVPGYWLTD
jgi:PQQ-dependent dehydrogenase (methanol/ethanol family)